jgi:dipeptidyl aminopeptidase/acylaminoacyl peptidase
MFSPDGNRFVWLQWFHPDMPWEGAEIHIADVTVVNGAIKLSNPVHVAGKRGEVSVSYPSWVSNDKLVFTSDESGYQNPWVYSPGSFPAAKPVFYSPIAQDFGGPAWMLGGSPFALLDSPGKSMIFVAMRDGRSVLYIGDLESQSTPQEIECPYFVVQNIRQAALGKPEVVFIGCKMDESPGVIHCTLSSVNSTTPTYTTLKSTTAATSAVAKFPPELVSIPQPISLQIPQNRESLHVVFYPPTNPDYAGTSLPGELPPCVLHVHGGPTGMTGQGLDWKKTFYTSRGWAWYVVQYYDSIWYDNAFFTQARCELWLLVWLWSEIYLSRFHFKIWFSSNFSF